MSGPLAAREALAWIQEALASGRYTIDVHFERRCQQRRTSTYEAKLAIARASRCTAYADRAPLAGGTSWRVVGPDPDGDDLTVGVEAFRDHLGRRALLVTIF